MKFFLFPSERDKMEGHFNKMLNSLIEICIVAGMDQDTGLVPSSRQEGKKEGTDCIPYSTVFETSVLAAISGETALFPCTSTEVDGEPFYPSYGIMCTPTKGGARRRRGSCVPGMPKPAELPLGLDVINSLPPLCFPDGGLVCKKRKPVSCHSLVLTDIEGNRKYCACMTFYRAFIIQEVQSGDTPRKYNLLYMDNKVDEKVLQDSPQAVCFVPTCCCLISKWPYFSLMKDCLSCLLPQVMTTDVRSFRMALMGFVSQLAMVPVPPPGSLALEFELCGVKHLLRPADDPETRVIDMELHYPFLYFSLDDILLLIGCILTQQRIVFLSSSYSVLTLVIESFFTFIQPFSWSWTYVPILPSALLDLVEAPGAFIMGCHASHKTQIQRVATQMDELSSIAIADIDDGTVTLHPKAKIPRLPTYVTDMFKFRMKNAELHFDKVIAERQTFFTLEEFRREREAFVRKFQQLVLASTLEMMLRMFSDMKTCIVQQGDLFFDLDSFIESKPFGDQDFYREVCKSHAFSTFLYDLIRDPEKTDYFTLMAQRTRVIPKAAPIRKRSSSSVPIPVISDEFFVNPQANLSIFTLPPFASEGIYTGSFYAAYLKSLDEKISELTIKSSSLVANYLYLRGMLRVACGQNLKAVDDFFLVSSRNVQIFPTKTVQEIMCKLHDSELEELRTRHFWRKAEHLRRQAEEKVHFRRDRKEVVTSAIPSSPLKLPEFVKHVSRLQIANSQDGGERLFQALATNSSMVVEPETFAAFYEAYTQASGKARSVSLYNTLLGENEYVLKVSSQLVKTNRGMGFLVLTVNRLLFLETGRKDCHTVVNVKDIKTVEAINYSGAILAFTRGVTAIEITSKSQPSMSFVASLKEEKDFWLKCLLELQAGYKMADALKDPAIIECAAQNVMMADALRHSGYSEQTVTLVLYLNTQSESNSQLSNHTRKALFRRVDPLPQDMEKTTVEALLFLPELKDGKPKVWCAMGSSVIVVIDADAWEYETHMKHAKERVNCLLAVGQDQVWAGSQDNTIYIINTQTGKADQQLSGHRDILSHMIETQDRQGHTTVWSASSNGQIVGWDPVTLTAKKELQVEVGRRDEKTLYWFCAIGKTFWCATRFSVYVINYVEDKSDTKVLTPKKDEPMSIDCMCAVSDTRVWSACNRSAHMVIWNTATYEKDHRTLCSCGKCPMCKCGGFTSMIRVDQQVWVGSKSGTIYVMNARTVKVVMELSLHVDRIRAMCITDYGHVITGPGSRDGRIAVWKSYLTSDRPELKVESETKLDGNSTCEEDGFEVVCSKEKVRFDMARNDIRYIKNTLK